MWSPWKNSLQWKGPGDTLSFPVFHPEYSLFPGELLFVSKKQEEQLWYDHWVQCFKKNDEINFIRDVLISLQGNPHRIHIAGVSCVESVQMLAEYYTSLGYENTESHTYTLPENVLLTVSISLRHLLWCEKDKTFLQKKNPTGYAYYAITPPLRTPRDLRALQQGVRMGIIPCVDVSEDATFLVQLLEKQIVTPFHVTQIVWGNWKKYGFSGNEQSRSIELPDFSDEAQDELLL